jgi:hypothetical protein
MTATGSGSGFLFQADASRYGSSKHLGLQGFEWVQSSLQRSNILIAESAEAAPRNAKVFLGLEAVRI